MRLAHLVAVKLHQSHYFSGPGAHEQWEENEVDMCHLLDALAWALDRDSEYHKKHRFDRIPNQIEPLEHAFTAPIAVTQAEARTLMDAESSKERSVYGTNKFQSYFGRKDDDGVIHVSDEDDAPAVPVRFPGESSGTTGNPFVDPRGYDDPRPARDVEIDTWLDLISNAVPICQSPKTANRAA